MSGHESGDLPHDELGFDPDDEWALFEMEPEGEPTPTMAREMLRIAADYRLRPPWWAIDEQVRVNEEVERIWAGDDGHREAANLVLEVLGLDFKERKKGKSDFETFIRASLVEFYLREEESRTGIRPPALDAYAALTVEYPEKGTERIWERAYQKHRKFFEADRKNE